MRKRRKLSGVTPYAKRLQEITRIFDEFSLKSLKEGLAGLPVKR